MPGAAKKRPTEEVKVTVGSGRNARSFAVPATQKREVVKFIASCIKQAAREKSVVAEKALPNWPMTVCVPPPCCGAPGIRRK